jgi:hypothetical protein
VKWNVSRSNISSVNIFVNGINNPENLWAAVGLSGDLETGPWVSDGLTFTLKDQDGNILAKRTIETIRCVANTLGQ